MKGEMGSVWSWSPAAPAPTDPSKGWVNYETTLSPFGVAHEVPGVPITPAGPYSEPFTRRKLGMNTCDAGDMVGLFWEQEVVLGDPKSGWHRTLWLRARCMVQTHYYWQARYGVFLGNPDFKAGSYFGSTEQDKINGILVGLEDSTALGNTRNLYAWKVTEGVRNSPAIGYHNIPAISRSQDDYYLGGIYEYEAAFMLDDYKFKRGGYDGGVYDPDRVTGWSFADVWVRWNTYADSGNYSTNPHLFDRTSDSTLTLNDPETGTTSPIIKGNCIRQNGHHRWFEVTSASDTDINVRLEGTPLQPGTYTVDYYNPAFNEVWNDWQWVAQINDKNSPTLMKRLVEGDLYVGLLIIGDTHGAAGEPGVYFSNVRFHHGRLREADDDAY